jgi:translocation and assembly module TamB
MNDDLTLSPGPATPPTPETPRPKRRRVLRWVVGLFLVLLLLVGLVLGLAWYTVSSERGTAFALKRLGGMLPGELTVGSQRGPLTGPLELRDVHYRTPDGLDVRVKRAELAWDAGKLRRRQVDVQRLHAEGIRVTLPPAKEEDATEDGRLVDIHLPVNIIVRDALIRDLEIVRPGEAPFRLDRIALDGRSSMGSDVLEVRSLEVDGPTFDLRAEGQLTPVGAYPVDLRVRATYDDPAYPPFVVAGDLDGDLEKLGVNARLTQPFDARVQGSVTTPMRELGLDLSAQVRGLQANEINPEWPVGRVDRGDVKIKGQLDDFVSEGKVVGSYEDMGSGEATYRLARKGEEFFFEYLNLKTENGSDLSAKGTVGTGAEPMKLDIIADWRRLAWPLRGAPTVVSRGGEATVRGTLADYRVELDADLAGPSIPPGRWALAGRGGEEKMEIRSLRGSVLSGRLAASGTVAWKPRVEWRVKVNGENLNPAAQPEWAAWPARLSFAATSDGHLADAGPFGRVDLTELDGNLRGNPVAGRVHLELLGDRYRLPRLDLRSGSARVTAAGTFSADAGNLDFQLDAPNLGEALPDAGGSLMARGNVSGPWKAPRVRAQANGERLVFRTNNAETLALVADVDLSRNGNILVDLDAGSVGMGEQRFETVTLDGQGTRQNHNLVLAVRAEEGNLDLGLAGAFDQATTTWNGGIQTFTLANEETGTWRLAGPAGLTAGTTKAALRDFCWVSADNGARLCAQGSWAQAGPWSASGTVDSLPFTMIKPFLPPDLEITGGVNGTFAGEGTPAGVVTANVDLRPGPGEIRYPTESGETATIRYEQGAVLVNAGANGLVGSANLVFVDTGSVQGEIRLPQYNRVGAPLQQQTVDGRIVAALSNLKLVEAFVPDLENVQGTLNADVGIGGTVASPRMTGSANLQKAQMDVPSYGLELRDLQLSAQGQGQEPFVIHGSVRSGQGTVTVDGQAFLDERPTRLRVKGQRFLASNTEEIRLIVSPDLQIAMEGTVVNVTGDVQVPEAKIAQGKSRAAIPVSDDVVILPPSEEEVAQAGKDLEVRARVRVILGDEVEVKASGFSGEVTGSLLVVEQPGKATTGVGELLVSNGVYKAYGQDLTLERGRLVFAGGPVGNPGLDLRAFRRADDGTIAGIMVRGTLEAPQTTLYSDPPMGQSEALAYLLLGHPLGQATPQEGSLVSNAANSLGLKGGNLLAKRIGARFGLEEARIESDGGLDEARLVVGRYLSPRLYVTYGLGLFEPISTLRLRYILGRDWTLQAEQGEETRADILYRVERGKGGETPVPSRRDPAEPVPGPTGTGERSGGGGGGRP